MIPARADAHAPRFPYSQKPVNRVQSPPRRRAARGVGERKHPVSPGCPYGASEPFFPKVPSSRSNARSAAERAAGAAPGIGSSRGVRIIRVRIPNRLCAGLRSAPSRADLPPVVCLITRHAGGAAFRKLAPAQPVLVNGHPLTQGPLADGDRVSLGPVELLVHVTAAARAHQETQQATARPGQAQKALTKEQATRRRELDELARQLDLRRQQLQHQTEELEADRVTWYQRREEIEQEYRQRATLVSSEKQSEQPKPASELTAREEQLTRQEQELAGLRKS